MGISVRLFKSIVSPSALYSTMDNKHLHKPVAAIYQAGYTSYEGLDTYRAMPTRNVPIEALEPFIFLNHHGPQTFSPYNQGLPFGPHPHKGFETVTFIVSGDLVHQDSTGFNSNIRAGGIQWMTAGKGIIHSETSSEAFMEKGGLVEILQLWINLPARLKDSLPAYVGLQQNEIPQIGLEGGKVIINAVSGLWEGKTAPIQSISDVQLATVQMAPNSSWSFYVSGERTVLFYVIQGEVSVNGSKAAAHDLVEFENKAGEIEIKASADALLLMGHAAPNKEPIVAHGPFVMNSQEEIRQAFVDYQNGLFGEMAAFA